MVIIRKIITNTFNMPLSQQLITAVILAGGQGSRLGGVDKGLLELNKTALIQHVIDRIQPQVKEIFISANRNIEVYSKFGFPVFADDNNAAEAFAGPLAGILKALQHCQTEWLLTVPSDSPFISTTLVNQLIKNRHDELILIPHDGTHLQPTFALIHKSLKASLKNFLQSGERKTRTWMQNQSHLIVDFSNQTDTFININTEDDLSHAKKHFATTMS